MALVWKFCVGAWVPAWFAEWEKGVNPWHCYSWDGIAHLVVFYMYSTVFFSSPLFFQVGILSTTHVVCQCWALVCLQHAARGLPKRFPQAKYGWSWVPAQCKPPPAVHSCLNAKHFQEKFEFQYQHSISSINRFLNPIFLVEK